MLSENNTKDGLTPLEKYRQAKERLATSPETNEELTPLEKYRQAKSKVLSSTPLSPTTTQPQDDTPISPELLEQAESGASAFQWATPEPPLTDISPIGYTEAKGIEAERQTSKLPITDIERKTDIESQKTDPILTSIYNKYPAFKNMGNVVLKADKTFTRDKTQVGDIEFFNPDNLENNTITYNNGYKVKNPNDKGFGIIYNPDTNNEQNIMLDMLHGMTKDKVYAKHREEFSNAFLNSKFKHDLKREWEQYNRETDGKNDGEQQFKDNWIDGILRNLIFEGTDEDFKKAKYWKDAKKEYLADENIKKYFIKLQNYLKTGTSGQPELDMFGQPVEKLESGYLENKKAEAENQQQIAIKKKEEVSKQDYKKLQENIKSRGNKLIDKPWIYSLADDEQKRTLRAFYGKDLSPDAVNALFSEIEQKGQEKIYDNLKSQEVNKIQTNNPNFTPEQVDREYKMKSISDGMDILSEDIKARATLEQEKKQLIEKTDKNAIDYTRLKELDRQLKEFGTPNIDWETGEKINKSQNEPKDDNQIKFEKIYEDTKKELEEKYGNISQGFVAAKQDYEKTITELNKKIEVAGSKYDIVVTELNKNIEAVGSAYENLGNTLNKEVESGKKDYDTAKQELEIARKEYESKYSIFQKDAEIAKKEYEGIVNTAKQDFETSKGNYEKIIGGLGKDIENIQKEPTDEAKLYNIFDEKRLFYNRVKNLYDKEQAIINDEREEYAKRNPQIGMTGIMGGLAAQGIAGKNKHSDLLSKARGEYQAISEIYLANKPIESFDKKWYETLGISVVKGLIPGAEGAIEELKGFGVMGGKDKLNIINELSQKEELPLSDKDKENMENTIVDNVVEEGGYLAGSLAQLWMLGGIAGSLQSGSRALYSTMKSKNLFPKVVSSLLESNIKTKKAVGWVYDAAIEEMVFGATGMPLGTATSLKASHLIPSIKFKNNAIGRIFEPVVNAAYKQGLGVTTGMEVGEAVAVASDALKNNEDVSNKLSEWFDAKTDDTKGLLSTFIVNTVLFGIPSIPKEYRKKMLENDLKVLDFLEKNKDAFEEAKELQKRIEDGKEWYEGDEVKDTDLEGKKDFSGLIEQTKEIPITDIEGKTETIETPKEKEYDTKDKQGLPSEVGTGEKPIEKQPIEATGKEKVEASRDIQAPKEEVVVEEKVIPKEEGIIEEKVVPKEDMVLKEGKEGYEITESEKVIPQTKEEGLVKKALVEEGFEADRVLNESRNEVIPFNETLDKIRTKVKEAKAKLKESFEKKKGKIEEKFKEKEINLKERTELEKIKRQIDQEKNKEKIKDLKDLFFVKRELLIEKNKEQIKKLNEMATFKVQELKSKSEKEKQEIRKKYENKYKEYRYNTELSKESRHELAKYASKNIPKGMKESTIGGIVKKIAKSDISNYEQTLREVNESFKKQEVENFKKIIEKTKIERKGKKEALLTKEGIENKEQIEKIVVGSPKKGIEPLSKKQIEDRIEAIEVAQEKIQEENENKEIEDWSEYEKLDLEKILLNRFGNLKEKSLEDIKELQKLYETNFKDFRAERKAELEKQQLEIKDITDKAVQDMLGDGTKKSLGNESYKIESRKNNLGEFLKDILEKTNLGIRNIRDFTSIVIDLSEQMSKAFREARKDFRAIPILTEEVLRAKGRAMEHLKKLITISNNKIIEGFGSAKNFRKILKEKVRGLSLPSKSIIDITGYEGEINGVKKEFSDKKKAIIKNKTQRKIELKKDLTLIKLKENKKAELEKIKSDKDITQLNEIKKAELNQLKKDREDIEKKNKESLSKIKDENKRAELSEKYTEQVDGIKKREESLWVDISKEYKDARDKWNKEINEYTKKQKEIIDNTYETEISELEKERISSYEKIKDNYLVDVDTKISKLLKKGLDVDEAAHMIIGWDGSNRKAMEKAGISEEFIQKLREVVPEEVIEYGEWFRDEFLPSLKEAHKVYEKLTGLKLDDIDGYVPMNTKFWSNLSEPTDLTGAKIFKDFMHKREEGSEYKIGENSLIDAVENYMFNYSHAVEMAEIWSKASKILNSKRIQDAADNIGRKGTLSAINKHLEQLYSGKYGDGGQFAKVMNNKIMTGLRHNYISSKLLMNVSLIQKQQASIFAMFDGNWGDRIELMTEVLQMKDKDQRKVVIDMIKNMSSIQDRDVRKIEQLSYSKKKEVVNKDMFVGSKAFLGNDAAAKAAGYLLTSIYNPTQIGDRAAVIGASIPIISLKYRKSFVEYNKVYDIEKSKELAMIDAMELGTKFIETTQQTSDPRYLSLVQKDPGLRNVVFWANSLMSYHRQAIKYGVKAGHSYLNKKAELKRDNPEMSDFKIFRKAILSKGVRKNVRSMLMYTTIMPIMFKTATTGGTNFKNLFSDDEEKRKDALWDMILTGSTDWLWGGTLWGGVAEQVQRKIRGAYTGTGDVMMQGYNDIYTFGEDFVRARASYKKVKEKEENGEVLTLEDKEAVQLMSAIIDVAATSLSVLIGFPTVAASKAKNVLLSADPHQTVKEKIARQFFTKEATLDIFGMSPKESMNYYNRLQEEAWTLAEEADTKEDEAIAKKRKDIADKGYKKALLDYKNEIMRSDAYANEREIYNLSDYDDLIKYKTAASYSNYEEGSEEYEKRLEKFENVEALITEINEKANPEE